MRGSDHFNPNTNLMKRAPEFNYYNFNDNQSFDKNSMNFDTNFLYKKRSEDLTEANFRRNQMRHNYSDIIDIILVNFW